MLDCAITMSMLVVKYDIKSVCQPNNDSQVPSEKAGVWIKGRGGRR